MPPIASEAHWRFRAKASTRDPLDFTAYPTQRYSIYVDNGGLGPAVRVSIPYTLTVWDVDEQNVKRVDDLATCLGTFDVFHIQPGQQKAADIYIDTTYYPAFKLEFGKPTVVGLDNMDCSAQVTDLGSAFTVVEMNNKQTWDLWRRAVWLPSRPATVAVSLPSGWRRENESLVLPTKVAVQTSLGAAVATSVTVWVVNPSGTWVGPFSVQTDTVTELRCGDGLPGSYVVWAWAAEIQGSLQFTMP